MFNVKNGKYLSVKMDWDNITLPLNAGTPVSLDGAIANDDTAIGIVPQTVTVKPIIPEIYILNGGDVDLDEIEAAFGDELDEAAIAAMDGIRFWGANGTPVDKPSSGGGGGGVLLITATYDEETDIYTLDTTAGDIVDAMTDDGRVAVIRTISEPATGVVRIADDFVASVDDGGELGFIITAGDSTFFAASADDYPTDEAPSGGEPGSGGDSGIV